MDSSRKHAGTQRQPPPSLFQRPPSRNASNLSLAVPPASTLATPNSQQPSLQRDSTTNSNESTRSYSPFATRRASKNDVDGSDAIWQEMQSALSEVELSAMTIEHVFGEKHSQALEDLRMKQLKLAQAWARSEAEDEVVDSSRNTADDDGTLRRADAETIPDNTSTDKNPLRDRISPGKLDEETAKDIELARKRRLANDRYFERVNQGVLDVVEKLQEVSQAMRTVERESKDIWSDSESVTTEAPSSAAEL
ncbi:hypothetical protein N7468_000194 [Penicillium chermesinum]|uniref:Uncharacterized protein n=1 Tax=Penicillium chermesinum TaxID=63820 RepID=A0A9W9PJS5_9EURO|nr:uncharacterized protein N7468_000194 [Penicillium chermesinum]KAJ5248743.1 hypothetical protein N7468_000194 [Penicillium chermesinum]KAJ6150850.1 hypothetical protein N7470_007444 [Penicillium chermesinum]